MLELLIVIVLYFVMSFVGMSILWTVAVKKGVVRAPNFMFWLREPHGAFAVRSRDGGAVRFEVPEFDRIRIVRAEIIAQNASVYCVMTRVPSAEDWKEVEKNQKANVALVGCNP